MDKGANKMSNTVLIIGAAGSGKSTSMRNLDPTSTSVINVLNKSLPFKGFKKKYNANENNYFSSTKAQDIVKQINMIKEQKEIKTLVLDDWQYILSYQFMRTAMDKGYDKFNQLALHGFKVLEAIISGREGMDSFVLTHSDIQEGTGISKCKTIGKMLDEKICVEGLFTIVLHARLIEGKYVFQTQSDEQHLAKSPMGMFNEMFIPNDLEMIKTAIANYNEDGE